MAVSGENVSETLPPRRQLALASVSVCQAYSTPQSPTVHAALPGCRRRSESFALFHSSDLHPNTAHALFPTERKNKVGEKRL